ncbi:MAG: hypothetical protein HZA04_06110 [Nitrospinae bacterium]|nr:hypothetical protein [Nitrospinota bacterium]
MARAKVIEPVSGKPGWYLVEDHLGVRYTVQSGVDGYDFLAGEEYRLFAPGGVYNTNSFRLLPFKTARRWRSATELASTHPATSAALLLYADKIRQHAPQDREATVRSVRTGRLVFEEGGYAKITAEEETYYQKGDTVAVIHDTPTDGPSCLKSARGDSWTAGFAGKQTPRVKTAQDHALCSPFIEHWNSYPVGAVDFFDPTGSVPGASYLIKQNPLPNEAQWWLTQTASQYISAGMPYGQPAAVSAGNRLVMEAPCHQLPPITDWTAWVGFSRGALKPRPIIMPGHAETGIYGAFVSPPVVVRTSARRKLVCHGKPLIMRINLATEDTHNWYQYMQGASGAPYSGVSLPACMALVFNETPSKYLNAGAIKQSWWQDVYGRNRYATEDYTMMKKRFKLVYSAPGMADFAFARAPHPNPLANGQFALARAIPRYELGAGPGGVWVDNGDRRTMCNVPMDDPDTGFNDMGQLLTRCFDADGTDVTPPRWNVDMGGFFPGYFEIPSGSDTQRDLRADFLAAYPFMGNPDVNPSGGLPLLEEIWFYAQGRVALKERQGAYSVFQPNPTRLTCKLLELFF